VKKSEEKSTIAKQKKRSTGKKRKRRKQGKKLLLKDGIRAALIAAILISVTSLVAISLLVANSAVDTSSLELVQEIDPLLENGSPVEDDLPVEIIPEERPSLALPEESKNQSIPETLTETIVKAVPEVPVPKPIEEMPVQRVPEIKTPEVFEEAPKPLPLKKGSITLVMDDAGNNLHELDAFLAFSGPMTIAVLPGLPYSAEAARRIRAAGKEVILHQPMEALGGQNPGPGAIYSSMSDAEIRALVEKNLTEIGPVAGMNNHQGSKITMDERVMEIILSICHDQGIYFLDSRTTADTVAPLLAGRLGTKIWERDVFLDNIQEKAAMIKSFHEGLAKAEKKGGAIMIGHVWSSELAATLAELYPEMVEQGFSLSTISKVMMGTIDYDDSWD
jgi:polysaccharide deacetylase 2 family uncharacterized protein YibQ